MKSKTLETDYERATRRTDRFILVLLVALVAVVWMSFLQDKKTEHLPIHAAPPEPPSGALVQEVLPAGVVEVPPMIYFRHPQVPEDCFVCLADMSSGKVRCRGGQAGAIAGPRPCSELSPEIIYRAVIKPLE